MDAQPPTYECAARPSTSNPQLQVLTTDASPFSFAAFKIGSNKLEEPLVKPEQIIAHLRLLEAFRDLRKKVEGTYDPRFPVLALSLDPKERWAWFVSLAVER